jgi:hypothetical protein
MILFPKTEEHCRRPEAVNSKTCADNDPSHLPLRSSGERMDNVSCFREAWGVCVVQRTFSRRCCGLCVAGRGPAVALAVSIHVTCTYVSEIPW